MKRFTLFCLLAPTAAFAHPGDHGRDGFFHLLTEPDHLALLGAVLVAAVMIAFKLRAKR